MIRQRVTVTSSITTSGPGLYVVTTTNPVTITLENNGYWTDANESIQIKDMSGAPQITVAAQAGGLLDGSASVSISQAYELLAFVPNGGGGLSYLIK